MSNVIEFPKADYDCERTKAVWDNMLKQAAKFNLYNLFLNEEAA